MPCLLSQLNRVIERNNAARIHVDVIVVRGHAHGVFVDHTVRAHGVEPVDAEVGRRRRVVEDHALLA